MFTSATSSTKAQQHATRAAFFIPGFATAIWAVLVPFAKERTGIDDGLLGLVLLCLGAGSIIAMPISGALAARFGCRNVMITTVIIICGSLPVLAIANNAWFLAAALFVFGTGVGAMDCTMNMQAVVVERDSSRAMMSGFHAFFSIGGFAGAAAMTLLFAIKFGPLLAASLGVLTIGILALASCRYWRGDHLYRDGPIAVIPRGVVLLLGVLAFVVFLAEGTMLDWSAVFLTDVREVNPDLAGAGYVVFALTMTLSRLFGDSTVEFFGRTKSILIGSLLACVGLMALTFLTPWELSLLGYALLGVGCSNIVPAIFSLAGNQKIMPENIAVTAVTTLGYSGILAGPAIIGFVAHGASLIVAFTGVAILLLIVAFSSRFLDN